MFSGKQSNAADTEDVGLIPGSGRSSGEGNGNMFQYSSLENTKDRETWRAIVHGAARSWPRLSDLTAFRAVNYKGCTTRKWLYFILFMYEFANVLLRFLFHVHERYCLQFYFLAVSLSGWVSGLCWAPKCLGKHSLLYFLKMISHARCNFQPLK